MEVEFPRPTEDLGDIAAQTAKQVIFQKVGGRARERFAQFNQQIGDVKNGIVADRRTATSSWNWGRIEAVLPRKEQSRAESDRRRTVFAGDQAREPQRQGAADRAVTHRSGPADRVVRRRKRPRLYDGTVMILGAVREQETAPRLRSTPASATWIGWRRRTDEGHARPGHHPRKLRGEKIDIVEFSEDPDPVCHRPRSARPRCSAFSLSTTAAA